MDDADCGINPVTGDKMGRNHHGLCMAKAVTRSSIMGNRTHAVAIMAAGSKGVGNTFALFTSIFLVTYATHAFMKRLIKN